MSLILDLSRNDLELKPLYLGLRVGNGRARAERTRIPGREAFTLRPWEPRLCWLSHLWMLVWILLQARELC